MKAIIAAVLYMTLTTVALAQQSTNDPCAHTSNPVADDLRCQLAVAQSTIAQLTQALVLAQARTLQASHAQLPASTTHTSTPKP